MLQQLSTALRDTSLIDGQSFLAPTHLQVGSHGVGVGGGAGAARGALLLLLLLFVVVVAVVVVCCLWFLTLFAPI